MLSSTHAWSSKLLDSGTHEFSQTGQTVALACWTTGTDQVRTDAISLTLRVEK
jgi:hypothetical protein